LKIKHLNLTVSDVAATREFLEKYFGLTCSGARGNGFAVMRDNDEFILFGKKTPSDLCYG
jgi:catechol 2,3-dioxygenase-like lactoylglutathione lyase family enzyme